MARSKTTVEEKIPPSLTPVVAIGLIKSQQEKGSALLNKRLVEQDDMAGWKSTTHAILVKAFGSPSEMLKRFDWAGRPSWLMNQSDGYYENLRFMELSSKIKMLDSCIEVLEIEAAHSSGAVTTENRPEKIQSRDVFVVHGSDDGTKETVARFLSQLKLNPIILHERADKSRTIIEKFEQEHRSASFAVVLMTPDDLGQKKGETSSKPRARQNVILELGFFLGKLGREKVFVLYDPSVEMPYDYSGVLYTKLNDENWKLKLVKELKGAGIDVDANFAL